MPSVPDLGEPTRVGQFGIVQRQLELQNGRIVAVAAQPLRRAWPWKEQAISVPKSFNRRPPRHGRRPIVDAYIGTIAGMSLMSINPIQGKEL